LSRWKEFWVIDEIQRFNTLNPLSESKASSYIVGVPWWTDTDISIEVTKLKSVAIFDFEPHVGHFGLTTYNSYGYQDPAKSSELLRGIVEECAQLGLLVRHKPKRDIGSRRHKLYKETLEGLQAKYPNNYLLIDSRIAPSRLICQSDACISVAFTTTSIIASQMNKPTAFYTMSVGIPDKHPREFTIPLFSIQSTLRVWLSKQLLS